MGNTYLYPGNRISLSNGYFVSSDTTQIGVGIGDGETGIALFEGSGTLDSSDIFVNSGGLIDVNSGESLTLYAGDVHVTDGKINIRANRVLNVDAERVHLGHIEEGQVDGTGELNVFSGKVNHFLSKDDGWDASSKAAIRIHGTAISGDDSNLYLDGNGRIVLGGGSASTGFTDTSIVELHGDKDGYTAGRLELNGGEIDAGFVRLYGDADPVDGPVVGVDDPEDGPAAWAKRRMAQLVGNGTINVVGTGTSNGKVTSGGNIRTFYNEDELSEDSALSNEFRTVTYPDFYYPREAQLFVNGNLTLKDEGILDVRISERNQFERGSLATGNTSVLVSGDTEVAGTLNLTMEDDLSTEVGDAFNILVSRQARTGRFSKVTGTNIDECSFFGLRYRNRIYSNGVTGAINENAIEAIVLEKPRWIVTINPDNCIATEHYTPDSSKNLVLVTHGTKADTESWVQEIAISLQTVANRSGTNFRVVRMDWRDFGGGGDDDEAFVFNALLAGRNARDIGESIGHWLAEQGITEDDGYDRVHLLGHSAGAHLIDSLADFLVDKNIANDVHLTFFDAYITKASDLNDLGDKAQHSEHFVDSSYENLDSIGDFSGFGHTNGDLSNAYNFDVKDLRRSIGIVPYITEHAWPYEFYKMTSDPSYGQGLGVNNNCEAGEWALPVEFAGMNRGERRRLLGAARPITIFDLINQNAITDGLVRFNQDGGFALETASPSMVTFEITLEEKADFLSFDFQFSGAGPGLLSVYFDGEELVGINEGHMGTFKQDEFDSGDVWLGSTFEPGTYSLLFRLDPLGDSSSIVSIDNVAFGLSDPVLLGDFNLDGEVDCDDLDGYVGTLGATVTAELAPLDLDSDGTISAADANTHITTLVQTTNGRTGTFPGDLNCDGVVNVLGDAFALVGNLGNSVTSYSQGDINFDGTVDVLGDAFILIGNLGSTNEP